MTYAEFKKAVQANGWTVAELRSDDAPPSQELLEFMDEVGLAKYERFVLKYKDEPTTALADALRGFLHADPDVFAAELAAARSALAGAGY